MGQRLRVRLYCGRRAFDPWVWKVPWRRKWQPTPVVFFLPPNNLLLSVPALPQGVGFSLVAESVAYCVDAVCGLSLPEHRL